MSARHLVQRGTSSLLLLTNRSKITDQELMLELQDECEASGRFFRPTKEPLGGSSSFQCGLIWRPCTVIALYIMGRLPPNTTGLRQKHEQGACVISLGVLK